MNDNSTQRDALMRALAAAEHLISVASKPPFSVDVREDAHCGPGEVSVTMHFPQEPTTVRRLAERLGATLETRRGATQQEGRPYLETTATGRIETVPFFAWTRENLPTLGQPADERAQAEVLDADAKFPVPDANVEHPETEAAPAVTA